MAKLVFGVEDTLVCAPKKMRKKNLSLSSGSKQSWPSFGVKSSLGVAKNKK
jgi:hypothetical protein